jgi:hypothetical protein
MIRIFASLIGIAWIAALTPSPSLVLGGQTFSPAGSAEVMDLHTDLVPTWTGGALIAIESQNTATPIIHLYDETGQEMLPIAFSIPGARAIHIQGFCRGSDGTFAVAGWIAGQDLRPKEGFLSLVSPDHRTIQTTRPAPYFPMSVTIAPDGTLWTMGAEMVNGNPNGPGLDPRHGLIRHFDKNGSQIGSFVPRSDIGKWPGLSGSMVSSKDRVGWYARSAQLYYEVTFEGKATRFSGIASPENRTSVNALALTDDNQVFAEASQPHKGSQLYRLDRTSGAWVPIAAPAGTTLVLPSGVTVGPKLFGGDLSRLAFQGYDTDNYEVKFFNVGAGQ